MSKQTGISEMRARLGLLAKERRDDLGLSLVKFAKVAGIGSDRTVKNFESAIAGAPDGSTQRKLEAALGWRRGCIRDLLIAAEDGDLGAADVDQDYLVGLEPVSRASELEDAELLGEVIRRLERWQEALS